MEIIHNPEDMSLDALLAEIIGLAMRQGNQDIAILYAKTDARRVQEVNRERSERMNVLCNEIRRRIENEDKSS
jgi:hypothetical protein